MAFLGYDDGCCESCEGVVREGELQQCHLGFCGTFLCTLCIRECSSCINERNYGYSAMVFCPPCSDKVVPKCSNCKDRFCGRCRSFAKCKCCSRLLCSVCLLQRATQRLQDGICNFCVDTQRVQSLESMCRSSIRKYIACNLPFIQPNQIGCASPTERINEVIDELCLPRVITERMKKV